MDLRSYQGKRICILLPAGGKTVAACGIATYEEDDDLGGVLHITLDSPGGMSDVDVFISESQWKGQIVTDSDLDCDFCFVPDLDEEAD